MTRTTYTKLALLLFAAVALVLSGCGGDDDGLSASDMARIQAADDAATAAQAEIDSLQTQIDALESEADAEPPEADTSALDEAIAALQIAALITKTADPMTPLEILGGTKSTASVNDRAALATKIASQLNATYDHDDDMSMVELADIDGAAATSNAMTRDRSHASNPADAAKMKKIMADKGGFLMHTFAGTGTTVDLTSPGDIATLKLGNLLKVDGVDLKSFSLRETDKVMTVATGATGDADPAGAHMTTTTLGADGSMSAVTVNDGTKAVVRTATTTFGGGASVVATNVAGLQTVKLTLADGRNATYTAAADATAYTRAPLLTAAALYDPYAADDDTLPAGALADAKAAYANAGAGYTVAQHTAMGYGAWLTDSFFVAYTLSAEDDAVISDPDEVAMKIAWGGRAADSDMASDLSGRGETAVWKGLMVGHDMDADQGPTYGDMLKGNAMITARVGEATLADNQAANVPDIVDVSLTNIINDAGKASRVPMLEWTNLDLNGGSFAKGTEIVGGFYDNGNEVVGQFSKSDIMGVFGAVEYDMPAMGMMDDMASGN